MAPRVVEDVAERVAGSARVAERPGEVTVTGGDAGSGGANPAGAGGNGGAPEAGSSGTGGAPPACSLPTDCSNTDEEHCECVDAGGGSCVLRGKDVDSDTHRDALCAGDAGADDCDDAHATAYPEAPELCDSLDNDCDGLIDVDDGLPLYGTTTLLIPNAEQPRVAWSNASNSYGLAWQDDTHENGIDRNVWFQRLSSTGVLLGSPLRVSAVDPAILDWHAFLAMAAGDTEFAVVYAQQSDPDPGLYFQRIGATGGLLGARQRLSSESVAWATVEQVEGGSWYVFWTDSTSRVQGAELSASGAVVRRVRSGTTVASWESECCAGGSPGRDVLPGHRGG